MPETTYYPNCECCCCSVLGCHDCKPGCEMCVEVIAASGVFAPLVGLTTTATYNGQSSPSGTTSCDWLSAEGVTTTDDGAECGWPNGLRVRGYCNQIDPADDGYTVLNGTTASPTLQDVVLCDGHGAHPFDGVTAVTLDYVPPTCDPDFFVELTNTYTWCHVIGGSPPTSVCADDTITFRLTKGACPPPPPPFAGPIPADAAAPPLTDAEKAAMAADAADILAAIHGTPPPAPYSARPEHKRINLPCARRGDQLTHPVCGCQGAPVYACPVYGECVSVANADHKAKRVAECVTCPDYRPPG